MKAILVIDVPNNVAISECVANCKLVGKPYFAREYVDIAYVVGLKVHRFPLKQHIKPSCTIGETYWYCKGWNDCIDEILGEKQ